MSHESGTPDRTFNLRRVTINSFNVVPTGETRLRSRSVGHFERGTDTTPATRDGAQQNVPRSVEAIWATNAGNSGRYGAPNPPPQSRGRSWTAWGAGIGTAVGAYVGAQVGRGVGSATGGWGAQLGESAGQYLGAGLGALAGAGLGAFAGYMASPRQQRYDAGHMLPNQMGGAGHRPENIFGQNPQINRGNRLDGQPTYQQFRAGENDMARNMKRDGGGMFTFKTRN